MRNEKCCVPVKDKLAWSVREVAAMVGLGERTIWRMVDLGTFPKPRCFGRRKLWLASEVKAWLASQAAAM